MLKTTIERILSENVTGLSFQNNVQEIAENIYDLTTDDITLDALYDLAAKYSHNKILSHPDYGVLASRLATASLHNKTDANFLSVCTILHQQKLISDELIKIVSKNAAVIQAEFNFDRDYKIDYFGIRTLEMSYLLSIKKKVIERPQHMWMRVAIGIHGLDLKNAFETYHMMSNKLFTHATPTLFNAGTNKNQMSSCFLLGMADSIEGIYEPLTKMAHIAKLAGGLGVHISEIRAKGSIIASTGGLSGGIVPLCILLNAQARLINQGGKRPGSIAVYLEPWHADVFEFCELKLNIGEESSKARDLFYALWIPDLFMRRVANDEMWSLMCPNESPGLVDKWGAQFDELYLKYESQGKYRRQVRALDLWNRILKSQIETGSPYWLYKDTVNAKSNQQNLGTIRSANLCAEITEYSTDKETAVCNLASICLPSFVDEINKTYDYDKLGEVTRVVTRNLNLIIDRNYYPTPCTRDSNLRHRPIGIGVQGLADVYNMLVLPYSSTEASNVNRRIFETIYYNALDESCKLAQKYGEYQTFAGSPFSKGILQMDMWANTELLTKYDWKKLRADIIQYGTRNSLLTTVMPTASTGQIMGFAESAEPFTSNMYLRSTMAGEFIVINPHLMRTLVERNLWSMNLSNKILARNGSIQGINEIPIDIQEIYKTTYELPQMDILDQAAGRGPFIDQSQSTNLYMERANFDVLSTLHFYSWQAGLKTGMYYLKSRPAVDPKKILVLGDEVDTMDTVNTVNTMDKVNGNGAQLLDDIVIEDEDFLKKEVPEKNANAVNDNVCESCSG